MAQLISLEETKNQPIPEKGILSQTLLKNDHTSLVFMQLAEGEELTEHTSKFPVWIYTVDGKGKLKTPGGEHPMQAGNWIYLEPKEEHAVYPEVNLQFVLLLIKKEE